MSVRKEIIAGLITALEAVKNDSSYPIKIKSVKEYDENYLTFENHEVPAIMVDDTGQEDLVVRKNNAYKYALNFAIGGFVTADSKVGLRKDINDIQSFIKQFIDSTSGSTIHAAAQNIEFESSESIYHQSDSDPEKMMALTIINVSMRYYISGGSF